MEEVGRDTENPTGQDDTLRNVAKLSNALAKKLTGGPRTLAYRIKAAACSSLIVQGYATVNGRWPGDIVGLDFIAGRDSETARIHIRRSHLSSEAKQILDRKA